MIVFWEKRADRDRDQAFDHIAGVNLAAAWEHDQRITQAVGHLAKNPRMRKPGRVIDTRELPIVKTKYIAVYRVTDRVEVIRLLHGAQQYP